MKKTVTPITAVDDKSAGLRADNAQACLDLAEHLGAERWVRVITQCETQGMSISDIEALCGKMRRTRQEWHRSNAALALHAAAMGLIIAIGSPPSEADLQAYDAAVSIS